MFKCSKTDEKVLYLKLIILRKYFCLKSFFQFLKSTIVLICLSKSFKKKPMKQ